MSLDKKKSADEDNPCAIIMIIAPYNPILFSVKIPVSTNPMCATDEYAISDFKSFWRIQLSLVADAPINLILIIQWLVWLIFLMNKGMNRINP